MSKERLPIGVAVALFLCLAIFVQGKDGLIFSDTPPIVIRSDGVLMSGWAKISTPLVVLPKMFFTNASDEILHGITFTQNVNGKDISTVILDTIKPHATAEIGFYQIASIWADSIKHHLSRGESPDWNFTIVCKDYSKPLKGSFKWVSDDRELAPLLNEMATEK